LAPGPVGADLVVGIPLGMLRAAQVAALAALTDEVVLTPWRSLVIPNAALLAPLLRAVGLTATPTDPWARLSACTGAPWCARTTSPTMDLARASARNLGPTGPRVHVVGCERACGAPTFDHVLVVDPRSVEDILTAAGVAR
jgi:precorrin-3B synthase